MGRKNHHASMIESDYYDARFVARFLGISLNALHLRLYFHNFPQPIKINGRIYFKMEEILTYIQHDDEKDAFAFLMRDEIRSFIDLGVLTRHNVGEMIESTKASTLGARVYARPISFERALLLKHGCEERGIRLEITNDEFTLQKKERLQAIQHVWEKLQFLLENKKMTMAQIGQLVNKHKAGSVGRSILLHAPSFKVAKILQLQLLKRGVL